AELAGNGEEALDLWREGTYGLIITDLHMPIKDGYMLARRVRQEEPVDMRIPIIALTANALRGEAAKAYAAGVDEYLTKPLQLMQLEAALAKHLRRQSAAAHPARRSVTPARAAVSVVDLDVLRALIGDDEDSVQALLAEYYAMAQ